MHSFDEDPSTGDSDDDSFDSYDSYDDVYYHRGNHRGSRGNSTVNQPCCSNCMCYICDVPVATCNYWYNKWGWCHCNSHPDDGVSIQRRYEKLVIKVGPGPFEPDHEAIKQDKGLTECRHCGWYSRLKGSTDQSRESKRDPRSFEDWCHACGRVANVEEITKVQSTPCKLHLTDSSLVCLGTKEIAFKLHIHDPRKMEKFATNWCQHEDKTPGWEFDEAAQEEELFLHRFGARPTLNMILSSIPTVSLEKLPTDGRFYVVSSNETEAMLLENYDSDLLLLREINRNNSSFGMNETPLSINWLFGDIEANWDREKRRGVSVR